MVKNGYSARVCMWGVGGLRLTGNDADPRYSEVPPVEIIINKSS